jgi:transcriptional/translational regulatory protein YebC/TACO1
MHSITLLLLQWSKIKHKKGAKDQAKGNMYSILSRELISAVRIHPSHSISPDQNTRLALLLKKAKDLDVPKEKVEATLQKAAAAGQGANNITYEILGPPTKENVPVALIM